jgi:hypothetical protein
VEMALDDGSKAYYTLLGMSPTSPDCADTVNYCVKSVGTYNGTRRALQIAR